MNDFVIFYRAEEALSEKHKMKLNLQEKEGTVKDLERKWVSFSPDYSGLFRTLGYYW